MQYEHQNYAEVRSLKKLGHRLESDDAEIQIEQDREERETRRRDLKQELAQLEDAERSDPERKAYLEEQLDCMREEDDRKLILYRQTRHEASQLIAIWRLAKNPTPYQKLKKIEELVKELHQLEEDFEAAGINYEEEWRVER